LNDEEDPDDASPSEAASNLNSMLSQLQNLPVELKPDMSFTGEHEIESASGLSESSLSESEDETLEKTLEDNSPRATLPRKYSKPFTPRKSRSFTARSASKATPSENGQSADWVS
jgi:hypothetical protein